MNESNLTLDITVDEHEALIGALNNYYDIISDVLPKWAEDLLYKNQSYEINKYKALKKVREKLLNSWSDRFDG
jgi:hypothetical protein